MPQLRDDTSNIDILNAIRSDARYDYQNMVPEATKANIQETIAGNHVRQHYSQRIHVIAG